VASSFPGGGGGCYGREVKRWWFARYSTFAAAAFDRTKSPLYVYTVEVYAVYTSTSSFHIYICVLYDERVSVFATPLAGAAQTTAAAATTTTTTTTYYYYYYYYHGLSTPAGDAATARVE